ncbi:hypothetical protein EVAR_46233_1 [Eumeta japonica]|uniref:Uncharacterized protein n=1 Tax=Eumeta variegata TaxID=151549 RepID=A0A4C1XQL9_EUMVA|nr:hypothetical protein EVAR_46233_1 [Eumeta japonica]
MVSEVVTAWHWHLALNQNGGFMAQVPQIRLHEDVLLECSDKTLITHRLTGESIGTNGGGLNFRKKTTLASGENRFQGFALSVREIDSVSDNIDLNDKRVTRFRDYCKHVSRLTRVPLSRARADTGYRACDAEIPRGETAAPPARGLRSSRVATFSGTKRLFRARVKGRIRFKNISDDTRRRLNIKCVFEIAT